MKRTKRILSLFLVLALFLVFLPFKNTYSAQFFVDTAGHWAEEDILKWTSEGFVTGVDNYFYPDKPINRAELATILARIMKYPDVSANNPKQYFSDLQSAWYTEAIIQSNKAGIILGDEAGTVRPEANITRQEMVVLLARALCIAPLNSAPNFNDSSSIAPFASGYVAALSGENIISGRPGNIFDPLANITRAETIHILNNAIADVLSTSKSDFSANYEIVNAGGVMLQNANIADNLILAEGIGSDTTTLSNANISKDLIVHGGNVSIIGQSTAQNMIINDRNNSDTITINPDSAVKNIEVDTPCRIVNYGGVDSISVMCDGATIESAAPINVTGNFTPNILTLSSTPAPTPTAMPLASGALSPTPNVPQETHSPSNTPWVAPTFAPTATPNNHQEQPSNSTPTYSPSPTPTAGGELFPAGVSSPSPTVAPSPSPTKSPSPTSVVASPSPTKSPSPTSVVASPSPTKSPSPSPSPTMSPLPSPTTAPSTGMPQYISLMGDPTGLVYDSRITLPFVFADEENIDVRIGWIGDDGNLQYSAWLSEFGGVITYESGVPLLFKNVDGDLIYRTWLITKIDFRYKNGIDNDNPTNWLVYPSN